MKNSLMGNMLYVDLTAGTAESRPTPVEWVEKYGGQKGLGTRILMEDFDPKTEAYAPENKVILTTSIMAGTPVSCSAKLAMTTKSPLTGGITDGSVGGHIGAELKYAGYDAVVITGKAKELSYLYIDPDKAEIRPLTEMKGAGSFKTEDHLKEILEDDRVKIMAIGPAGENLVKYSCVSSERYRQLGRGGIAAVMGSKNLKAVAIRGWLDVHVPDVEACMKVAREAHINDAVIAEENDIYQYGTPVLVDMSQESGLLPTRNFQEGTFEDFKNIDGESLKAVRKNKKACFSCGIACGNYLVDGETRVEGPEYETIALGGSSIGNGDRRKLLEFNARCDDLGLDTISAGGTIAYMMEATEKGLHDFGIRFGETDKALEMLEKIARREGVGDEAAEGSKRLAEKYGGIEFAIQVKGQELPGYDPRGSWAMGIAYVTAPRGGCHMTAYPIALEAWGELDPFTFEGKAKLVADMQNAQFSKFSLGVCDFWPVSSETLGRLFSVTYGGDWPAEKIDTMGERIFNLQALFNVINGRTRKDDVLPKRFHDEILKVGPPAGKPMTKEMFDQAMDEYYEYRDWDKEGRPTIEKLKALGIEEKFIQAYSKAL
ncbi:MAG: aldehyde ferredoxin oxidoreductase family protein [Spirochaetales bacterium]|nr:aldehyde ferredoxin oxidoreductase family protein [Spirochaetales bacterium]